ncbi:MAG: hypothetical protein WCR46_19560 [Deltaproteobacteria bacterium]
MCSFENFPPTDQPLYIRLLELDHVAIKPRLALRANIVVETMQQEKAALHVILVVYIRLAPHLLLLPCAPSDGDRGGTLGCR